VTRRRLPFRLRVQSFACKKVRRKWERR
jgi:hypothetical protein